MRHDSPYNDIYEIIGDIEITNATFMIVVIQNEHDFIW